MYCRLLYFSWFLLYILQFQFYFSRIWISQNCDSISRSCEYRSHNSDLILPILNLFLTVVTLSCSRDYISYKFRFYLPILNLFLTIAALYLVVVTTVRSQLKCLLTPHVPPHTLFLVVLSITVFSVLSLSLKCVHAPHELFTSVRTSATNQQRPVNGHYLLIYSTLFQ